MINPDMIPPEAVEAAARAIAESLRTARLTMECEDGYKPEARAAIAAALNAWPNGGLIKWPAIFLPLPQKEGDA